MRRPGRPLLPRSRAVLVTAVLALAGCGGDESRLAEEDEPGPRGTTLAVIGDTPYGDEQVGAFPALIDAVNRDRDVDAVLHVGDIKHGASPCTDAYFARARKLFGRFEDPFFYTPGDNEWTDCHLPGAGGRVPTERLASLRRALYPSPGRTLGRRPMRVRSQAADPRHGAYVENQTWTRSGVVFATVHVVGSDNDRAPWFGDQETATQRARRRAEYDARLAADLAWLDRTFATARTQKAAGVVLALHADMFGDRPARGSDPIVARIAERAGAFDGPVLLLNGDTHVYRVDRPLRSGSPAHGVSSAARNLTRIVVQGETAGEWLRVDVDPDSDDVFSWRREKVAAAAR